MTEFTGGEVYQNEFDPKAYLGDYYQFGGSSTIGGEWLEFVLKGFCKIFASGILKGSTLIDIGSGPTIYQFLPACESFETIIASDYLDQNRRELTKWIKNEPDAFDWSKVVKYVCSLEGNRDKIPEKEAKLRRHLQQVLKCDVHQNNPLAPLTLPPADCLLSTLCLEAACKDRESFQAALKNISSLLKLGGHLLLGGVLGCTFYKVGPRHFCSLLFTEEILNDGLNVAGFRIVEFIREPRSTREGMEDCDFSAKFIILACKEKEP